MRPFAKVFKTICALFIVNAIFFAGCSKSQPAAQRPDAEVGIVTLQTQQVALQSELAGRTSPSLMSDVRPQVSGIVKARLFEEGAQVKAGQLLYEIDPSTYQSVYNEAKADVANAEAAVAAAKAKDARYEGLIKLDGVSKQDADDVKASHQQAIATVALKKAALETARINLGYTKVRAPISGRI
jgi:membrane fusion protein (multidrug efflux system)